MLASVGASSAIFVFEMVLGHFISAGAGQAILIVGRLLLQSADFRGLHAHEPWGLVPAVVFCSAVVLLLGAVIEHGVRSTLGRK